MPTYKNSVQEIDLRSSLDLMSREEVHNKIQEVADMLSLDGTLKLEGLDLDEVCRCKYLGYITSEEFCALVLNKGCLVSIHERVESLLSAGLKITIKRLNNMRYYLEATR